MAIKIILAVSMLPVLLIMYGACWFLAGEKNGALFGVGLWEGAGGQPRIQEIKRLYKKELNLCALFCLLLSFLPLLLRHSSLVIAGMTAWTYFSVAFLLFPFQRANRRMGELKRECLEALPEKEKRSGEKLLVDVTAAGIQKPELPQNGMYAGGVFALLPAVAEVALCQVWRNPWLPELWVSEFLLLSIGGIAWLFLLYFKLYGKQRTKAFTYNSKVNLQVSEIRRYHWGRLCRNMAWMVGALNWGMLFAIHVSPKWFPWMATAASLLFGICSMAQVALCWQRIEKSSRKYLELEPLAEEDNDKYWIWGMFYYNKNDSRTMVEQRASIGMTYNMAKTKVKVGMAILFAVIFLLPFGLCGWMVLEEFTPVSLLYEDGVLVSRHLGNVYQIKREDIKQAVLLEEEPDIRKRSGTGMETVKKGDFYSEGCQRDFKVCINPQNPPFLMVEDTDGAWYLLGGSDGEEARDIQNIIQP